MRPCAERECRGITDIRLVDFDYVTLSSLNRHATAVLSDVGTPKVQSIERTLKQICRWVNVDARVDIWRKDQGGLLLDGADWVIGAYAIRRTVSHPGAQNSAQMLSTTLQPRWTY